MHTILEYSIILGFILSFILFFFNQGYKSANRFLGAFFFFVSLFVLSQYVGLYNESLVLTALFASAPTPFVFLIGPVSYFYVRSIIRDDATLSKYDYFHFLLFGLEFIGMIPYYFSSWEYKLQIAGIIKSADWNVIRLNLNWIFRSPINSVLRPLHVTTYLVIQWVLIYKYYKNGYHNSVPIFQKNMIKRWLIVFSSGLTTFFISYCILTGFLFIYPDRFEFQQKSEFFLLIGFLSVAILNIVILLHPRILYGLPRSIAPNNETNHTNENGNHEAQVKKSVNQELLQHQSFIIEERLTPLLQNKEPWVNSNFSLASLAAMLEVPEHHLRYYFNHHLNTSFPNYRNQLRVKHVKKLLESDDANQLSIEGIGKIAGFSSKSSFFAVFKNETGMTPHEYLIKIQDEA